MKRNDGFSLKQIAGVPYLLPFGQNIADFRRGIRINDTGALIWNLLEKHTDEGSLLKAVAEVYSATGDEMPELSKDLHQFLNQLTSYGMISGEDAGRGPDEKYVRTLEIGGITIDLYGEEKVYSQDFDAFAADRKEHADLSIMAHVGEPRANKNGTVLLRNRELWVMKCEDGYAFFFPEAKRILQARLKNDGSRADFYIKPPIDDTLTTDMFHAIRLVFLYLAQKRGMFAMHSASILYKGKLWLFSGRSGIGKSTHTSLWNRLYGTPVANGDLNLITISKGAALVHGIPWCGTSNLCDTNTWPLGGIVLLSRDSTDVIETLSESDKILLVVQRFISPAWTDGQLSMNLAFSSELIKRIPVCRLKCTDKPSAAERMKEWIDLIPDTHKGSEI